MAHLGKATACTANLLVLVLVLMLVLSPASEAALACSDVMKDLRPCAGYLQSGSGQPPAACCAGVSALASAASSTADKQAACTCIQNVAKNANLNINVTLAKALPGNCGIKLGFTVDPNTDCSKIN
ncbi:non-specific lipid-transfer protein 1-like [Diospyros lotus]|uniref:non-specific lipid-transfer protein 1-like n=1 Tax=Diospyros lotus TaxID=55363 RepID=UPI002256B83A|nr:non-specific lipid-transfer protein 1-like [Diospyros lotus]